MKLFGTDGVRGEAGKFLTEELAYKLGLHAANRLKMKNANKKLEILIGTDTRISCDMLKFAMISGITSVGVNVVDAGVIPTPAVSFLVRENKYCSGVMISASHNPFYDNGIKFFNDEGYKLSDEIEEEIEKSILENSLVSRVSHEQIGIVKKFSGYEKYIYHIQRIFKNKSVLMTETSNEILSLGLVPKKLKIAIDTANGACYKIAREIFSEHFEVHVINDSPNGININDNCGSTHMGGLSQYVFQNDLDLGIAFDGDGDRMLAVDSKGNILNGDELMLIFANYLHKNGTLAGNTLVATIMSNSALTQSLLEKGISTVKTKVGDRYVLEEMLENGYSLGGEDSGHIIFLDEATTGDGLLSAAMLLKIICEEASQEVCPSGKMQDLRVGSVAYPSSKTQGLRPGLEGLNTLVRYPQITISAEADDSKKKNFETKEILQKIDEFKLKHSAVTVRASGTEPVIRITIEGQDKEEIMRDARIIQKMIGDI